MTQTQTQCHTKDDGAAVHHADVCEDGRWGNGLKVFDPREGNHSRHDQERIHLIREVVGKLATTNAR